MTDKLTVELDKKEVRVLMAALSVLPYVLDDVSLKALVKAHRNDKERQVLLVMTAAFMAGAEHTASAESEMSEEALKENMERAAALLDKFDELQGGKASGMDN